MVMVFSKLLASAPRMQFRRRLRVEDLGVRGTTSVVSAQGRPRPSGPIDAGILFGSPVTQKSVAINQTHVVAASIDTLDGRFYQRRLPEKQIPYASREGRDIFQQALASGHMGQFFFLSEQFGTQEEPTFCGLSTLAMVLNSLRIDPMRAWKGVWRWFDEHNLGCCAGTAEVRERGLTFDMFKCLAECNGAMVEAHRASPLESGTAAHEAYLDFFRTTVRSVCSSSEREFLVACYSREALGQTGAGHFSPIGGYHEASDSVLIMDVARFKYPPHWVPLPDIARAMQDIDPDSGLARGFLLLKAHPGKDDPRHRLKPLHVPHIPKAAAKRLASALAMSLESGSDQCCLPINQNSWIDRAVCRWLHAVSNAEPQILRQVMQVGNVAALEEVISRLLHIDLFADLCSAYSDLLSRGLVIGFPPLRFVGEDVSSAAQTFGEDVDLSTCGELWILMLVLLPEHLRASVAAELSGQEIPLAVTKAVRGPWALPLDAMRQTLELLLQPPSVQSCVEGI
eukprot:TRINITY_DN46272_c0_g1_i1.p1 TRINITY_DN46272_c0_g1~~TRINITY_DN46272_c0_g1_i1.p1  ORF type:complete len:528 (+),score=21.50 TRINITY_DN46272_c0_g1_i1:54-1586(+)